MFMTREEKMRFYHSQAWRRMSERILIRDHYECQECKKKLKSGIRTKIKPATQVHHIVPVSRGGRHNKENLMALCRSCHTKIHHELGDR